jgi:hypothetical protein
MKQYDAKKSFREKKASFDAALNSFEKKNKVKSIYISNLMHAMKNFGKSLLKVIYWK